MHTALGPELVGGVGSAHSSTCAGSIEKVTSGLVELVNECSGRSAAVGSVEKKITSVECRLSTLEKSSLLTASSLTADKARKTLETVSDTAELLVCKTDSHSKEIEGIQEILSKLNDQIVSVMGLMKASVSLLLTTTQSMDRVAAEIQKKLKKQ
jgi:hypothetical protein